MLSYFESLKLSLFHNFHCFTSVRLPVNSSHGQLVTAQDRMTSWPSAEAPCCDELTCASNAVLSLLWLVDRMLLLTQTHIDFSCLCCVCFKSFLFSGTKYYYWCRGQHVACINSVQLSAIVIRCCLSSVVDLMTSWPVTSWPCDELTDSHSSYIRLLKLDRTQVNSWKLRYTTYKHKSVDVWNKIIVWEK